MSRCECLKSISIGQSAAKLQIGESSTTRVKLVGRSLPKWGATYLSRRYGLTSYESMRNVIYINLLKTLGQRVANRFIVLLIQ